MQNSEIKNSDEYYSALGKISDLMDIDPAPGTPELDLLEILSNLVEAYETKHYPIAKPSQIEAVKFRLDQIGI